MHLTEARTPADNAQLCCDFSETAYGIVKRAVVFRQWIDEYKVRHHREKINILDYGCGTGEHLTVPLGRGGDEVWGVDPHEPSVIAAKGSNTLPNVRFSAEPLESLRSRKETVDVVICSEVLEHTTDPGDVLKRLAVLLKDEGRLIISVPNGYGCFEHLRRLERALDPFGVNRVAERFKAGARFVKTWVKREPPLQGDPSGKVLSQAGGTMNMESGHVQFFRLQQMRSLFAAAGLEVVEERGRTLVCGPYVDFWLWHLPFRNALYRLNNRLADWCPLTWSSDWMFLLIKRPTCSFF
jgi:2-polyprenyl-3-methyl-5-hydroxy-6-metoxy-1,4-benzoquinol methylase